ncbi:MAG: hypothetical protein M1823_003427 [Watsoniomyces obsoletus]|nr:MAG: hypothetical protein M1823_003427 [Watsoniomyces obsoletus]
MAPPIQADGHKRVAESFAWYRYYARRAQRICVEKNLKTALDALIADRREEVRRPLESITRPLRRERLDRIMARLSPVDLESLPPENLLRIDIKTLERKVGPAGEMRASGGEPLAKKPKLPPMRCKCEITIWYELEGSISRSQRWSQLLRDSERCTIRRLPLVDGGMVTMVELDQAFCIKATKLLVPVKEQGQIQQSFARSYRLQVSLLPLLHGDGACPEGWPPIPIKDPSKTKTSGGALDAVDRVYRLDATLEGFLFTPRDGSLLDVKYALTRDGYKLTTDYAIRLEALWTRPSKNTSQSPTPEKPLLEERRRLMAPGPNAPVLVQYYYNQTPRHVGEFSVYRCLFCRGREFRHVLLFKFHLVTDHDSLDIKFSRGEWKDDSLGPLIVHVSSPPRASVETSSEKSFENWQWRRPQDRCLNLEEYFNGDKSWIIGEREHEDEPMTPPEPAPVRPTVDPDPIRQESESAPIRPIFEPDPIRPISDSEPQSPRSAAESPLSARPPARAPSETVSDWCPKPFWFPERWSGRRIKRYPVPAAPPDGFFVRTLTKRVVEEGEMLSESDDDVDETWRRRRHRQMISSRAELTDVEKAFVIRWNEHVAAEDIQAARFFPEVLTRFTETHRVWLGQNDRYREFYKHVSRLLLVGVISHQVVQQCLGIIRRAKGEEERNGSNRQSTEGDMSPWQHE